MIDFTNCKIEKASVHHVGNKTNNGDIRLSRSLLDISDANVSELLYKYFLKPFTNPEFYSFTFTNEDFSLNPMFKFTSQIFLDSDFFHETSINISRHLYELSVHPQIKSGDLFVVYFSDIQINNEITDAVGIFKSENRQAFLKIESSTEDFLIHYDDGINIEELDKGCLIFNYDLDSGFKVCIVDKSSKSIEAQFWKDNFLQLKPCSDNYHRTKNFMTITKNFVTKHLPEEYELSRADQIDYLNRSAEYFKTRETFEKNDFEKNVLQDDNVIQSFRNYDERNMDIESFEISPHAVKKQLRIYKSVLKLDNNFHIYIHGNREMIEQGTDKDGRKFYKIYFENES